MSPKTVILVLLACLVAFGIVYGGEDLVAFAQDDFSERKGIEGLLSSGRQMEGMGPTAFQKWLGFGSVVVAFIVWKWL